MAFNLPEAVKAAHNLSPAGQEKLKAAILAQYGPQPAPPKPESTPEDKEKAQRATESAKAAEEARVAAEDQAIRDILAAVGHGDLFDETRSSALRAIAEVIGVATPNPDPNAPTFNQLGDNAAATSEPPDLESKTVPELRAIAAERGVEIGSHAKKHEIIDALNLGRGGAK